ncbi:hypothetical protein CEXT_261291 [Caerostris extrusa]|uniref:Uncharacterized protein n=1 Tax=Caerostris extrusa TaxID=172846 RepID=A0AAV4U0G2_CAEEX|nr:hypothetical protein CEXT_261291 [Caerostris extrusa]
MPVTIQKVEALIQLASCTMKYYSAIHWEHGCVPLTGVDKSHLLGCGRKENLATNSTLGVGRHGGIEVKRVYSDRYWRHGSRSEWQKVGTPIGQ